MSMQGTLGALILAAGKGTRMHSDQPKVLKELLGEPMLGYVLGVLDPLFPGRVFSVIGHRSDAVRAVFPGREAGWVEQAEQLGTGHALQVAWDTLLSAGIDRVLVVNGDTPLITPDHVDTFLAQAQGADLAFMTLTLRDPGMFGRVVRKGNAIRIVEARDFDPDRDGSPTGEINAGVYLLDLARVEPLVDRLSNRNAGGEYYITDLVDLAAGAGLAVKGVDCGADPHLLGINSPRELVRAEEFLRVKIVDMFVDSGVTIHAPESVRIGPRVAVAPGAELFGPCDLLGATEVLADARIMAHTWIRDSHVDEEAEVRPFSHLEGARVGTRCWVGPYARLRPGAVLQEDARVGNFVEVKKAVLGPGVKAGHLSYLGDAEIGAGTNIGAGTITCNYDGRNKFKTVLGEEVFVGSNTALVAPVTVGKGALIGAGSVITKDVPDGEMAIARGRQKNFKRRG